MKPFLILQLRPIEEASNNEFEAFLKYGELKLNEVHRVRMEQECIPGLNLKDYSGVILGGGPSNVSDNREDKFEYQIQFETSLNNLMEEVIQLDFPFLGTCYGIGALNKHQLGEVSKEKYSEDVGAVRIELTTDGQKDDLLKNVPIEFLAYCGHKEACQSIPEHAVHLARSETCPYQMIRFKNNVYATQFHTELDKEGIELRIRAYENHGYFSPKDAESLAIEASNYDVKYPSLILRQFVEKYKRQ